MVPSEIYSKLSNAAERGRVNMASEQVCFGREIPFPLYLWTIMRFLRVLVRHSSSAFKNGNHFYFLMCLGLLYCLKNCMRQSVSSMFCAAYGKNEWHNLLRSRLRCPLQMCFEIKHYVHFVLKLLHFFLWCVKTSLRVIYF